jgi:hypothetical protein
LAGFLPRTHEISLVRHDFKTASAMIDRAEFPVQINNTLNTFFSTASIMRASSVGWPLCL